ncbi:MAG: acyl-CoA dehydrogenase family protein [Hyphomonadaceae bacterium]
MDLEFTAEDLAFRDEVRAWIKSVLTDDLKRRLDLSRNHSLDEQHQKAWLKELAKKGWLVPNWPVEYGGPGWTQTQKYIFEMECALAGTPRNGSMGVRMCAPVIMKFGTQEQKDKFLPPIRNSDVWWCQGYSEPGSGSDLASLQMTARREGDHYIVNGTKTWTTYAQWADWIFCLVRTSKEEKKQLGISFLLIDMKSPGITITPINTLDDNPEGAQEINSVFFDNVKVPVDNRIGEEGQGWTCAKYLLTFERGAAYAPGCRHSLKRAKQIAALEEVDGRPLSQDPDFARKIADLEVQIDALDFTERRIFSSLAAGQSVGAMSSLMKTRGSEIGQKITELVLEAAGNYGMPFVQDVYAHLDGRSNEPLPAPEHLIPSAGSYFNNRKTSIYAGSNEIQRNIMAQMIMAA